MNEKVLLSREKRALVAEGSPRLLTQRRRCENGADLGAVEQRDREKPVTERSHNSPGTLWFHKPTIPYHHHPPFFFV